MKAARDASCPALDPSAPSAAGTPVPRVEDPVGARGGSGAAMPASSAAADGGPPAPVEVDPGVAWAGAVVAVGPICRAAPSAADGAGGAAVIVVVEAATDAAVVDGDPVGCGAAALVVVVALDDRAGGSGTEQTSLTVVFGGGSPPPHRHASTSPLRTLVLPAPVELKSYSDSPGPARWYAQNLSGSQKQSPSGQPTPHNMHTATPRAPKVSNRWGRLSTRRSASMPLISASGNARHIFRTTPSPVSTTTAAWFIVWATATVPRSASPPASSGETTPSASARQAPAGLT